MKRRDFITTGMAACAAGLVTTTVGSKTSASRLALNAQLEQDVNPEPGEAMLTTSRGNVIQESYTGFADIEHRVPVNEATVFRIASMSKPIIACLALNLIDEGKLDIEDNLSQRLPDCPEDWSSINIEQLLSHTSGLSSDMTPVFSHLRDDLRPDELVALHFDLPLAANPRERWGYANINYWILGHILELVTGQPLKKLLQSRIFEPAEMQHSRLGEWQEIVPGRARGYSVNESDAWINAPWFSRTLGFAAGGILCTAQDWMRWCDALRAGRYFSSGLLDRMRQPVRLLSGESSRYGLGWFIQDSPTGKLLFHGGTSLGFSSAFAWRWGDDSRSCLLRNRVERYAPTSTVIETVIDL